MAGDRYLGVLVCAILVLTAGCAQFAPGEEQTGTDDRPSAEENESSATQGDSEATESGASITKCPGEGKASTAYEEGWDSLKAFHEPPFGSVPFSIDNEGKFRGEVTSSSLTLDSSKDRLKGTATQGDRTTEWRVVDDEYSLRVDGPDDNFRGRSTDDSPDGAFDYVANQLLNQTDEGPGKPAFIEKLEFADYETQCTTWDGTEAIKFSFNGSSEKRHVIVTTRDKPYRILHQLEVDPALDHHFRRNLAYDVESPSVEVSKALPLHPPLIATKVVENRTESDGTRVVEQRVTAPTIWTQFSETEAATTSSNRFLDRQPLEPGRTQLEGGTLTYEDADNNQLISPGDVLRWRLESGVVGWFFDKPSQKIFVRS